MSSLFGGCEGTQVGNRIHTLVLLGRFDYVHPKSVAYSKHYYSNVDSYSPLLRGDHLNTYSISRRTTSI
jgi:hypothetical protein